ncbi:hypothetical protein RCH14_004543 [Massilia sp. MP_M2]|uniref:hypothetical protein n=1 Tax=Massilia sp. MP_M2 TaxID=3071713 RepID=UPI00319DC959
MKSLLKQKIAIGVTVAFTGSIAYAYCPPQYMNETVLPAFASATAALSGAITTVDASLSLQLEVYSQRMTSAVAILTKQKALAANQVSDANRRSAEATAMALNAMAQTERVKRARFEYGGEFGQGFKPCVVYAGRSLMANRDAQMGEERRVRMMSEVVAAPGRYVDTAQAQAFSAKEHRELFCTADQVKSGMCTKEGEMAGASLNAATLFEPVMESDKLYRAKVAFVNNVVGLPDAPIPASAANSQAASAYALAKAEKDALMSPAIASLKEIQLEYTGMNSAHGGSDIPISMRMQREVGRYLGNGPEYEQWSKTMAGQNSRGLMVEMLKVKALDLVLLERQYRQYERMEANLATLVAGQMRSQSSRAAQTADQVAREQVKGQIK